MIWMGANTLKELINFVINTKESVGASMGRVISKKVVAFDALSSLAASYT